ncbi:E3 ubiquitin-protein ligase RNF8-like [Saccoglossus kowalevskii]|uniref:E3 ubiquitin-protein ligase CHFR n=1 Tax=Saccoglossus kowalevskii TaxID=10224 RepID=A0ABM0H080_SACKO|nr:PREDICTED: E3 ubiquitin-protein ligase RNF8-B-like [Saccoglossus kowalevskii]
MAASCWCLKRLGEKIGDLSYIPLPSGIEVTLGRGLDVTVQLLPDEEPLMISRKHAIFQDNDNTWTVVDNKSINGIFINGKKIKPLKPHQVKENDIVQIGKKPNEKTPPEFVFKFIEERHTPQEIQSVFNKKKQLQPNKPANKKNGVKRKSCDTNTESHTTRKKDCKLSGAGEPSTKRYKIQNSQEPGPSNISENSRPVPTVGSSSPTKGKKVNLSEKQLQDMKNKLKEQENLAEVKVQEAEHQLLRMQSVLTANENAKVQLEEKLKLREQEMLKEVEEQKERLQAEKELLQKQMKEFMEIQLKEKEEKMLLELKQQRDTLQLEKKKVEESLQKELQVKLVEKDKDLQVTLEKQKEKLEEIISRKELEYTVLESQLKESKMDKEQQELSIQKAKEEAIQNVADVMEDELQCSLCYELFVEATTLSCSHSFCNWCITEWLVTKKHCDCPVCRAKVTSRNKSIVLDSYIDKMVENLSDELKTRRLELIAERKKNTQDRGAHKRSPKKQSDSHRTGDETTTISARTSGPATRSRTHMVVIDSDSDDDDDDDDDDNNNSPIDISSDNNSDEFGENSDSSDVEGDSDAIYGGYGRCYVCGSTGHWAPGCPFR